MLTTEQIKKLKTDDKLLVQGEFVKAHDNGSILVSLRTKAWESSIHELLFFHPSSVSLPSEHGTSLSRRSSVGAETEVPTTKHDPCRKVKRGDRVKPRIVYGRIPIFGIDGVAVDVSSGDFIVETDEGERPNGTVDVKTSDGTIMTVDPVYLELITPVEELEPYKVWDTTFSFNVGIEDSKAVFYYGADMSTCPYTKEQAKAAAEAERDRLNAEWRKEQK